LSSRYSPAIRSPACTRKLLFTDFTPETERAISEARVTCACELTKPLNCTTWRSTATLISRPSVTLSANNAVLVLVAIEASSIYCPVERCWPSDAQAPSVAQTSAVDNIRETLLVIILYSSSAQEKYQRHN